MSLRTQEAKVVVPTLESGKFNPGTIATVSSRLRYIHNIGVRAVVHLGQGIPEP